MTDVDLILQASNGSDRPEETALVVADAAAERAAGRLAVIGGDFNEPSGEDWTAATADMFDHNGTVVAWPALEVLLDAGFVDSYREKFPDPVTHPGITWSIENPAFDPLELTWTPEADERDRIDFIFYGPDERIALEDSVVVGPQGTIVDGEVVGPDSEDPIVTPFGVWPSDHKAVLSTFSVCASGCAAAPQPEPSPEPTPDPTTPAPVPTDPPSDGGPAAPGDPGDASGVDDESPTAGDGEGDDLAVTGAQNAAVGWGIALAFLLAGVAAAIIARVRSRRRGLRD